jgi:hypothetical protein
MIAPLLGNNLVRLLYLDESGTDGKAPYICVGGLLVHGDMDWPGIDRRIVELIEKYVPKKDRLGFVFHAKDIYHGNKYFDRNRWSQEVRTSILNELALIISDLSLVLVTGFYSKDHVGINALPSDGKPGSLLRSAQTVAVMDCLMRADRWLAKNAPTELATVIHEDGTGAKPRIKHLVRYLRDPLGVAVIDPDNEAGQFGLPLKRIIDTVHFAEKPDARPLQLADLCAFIMGRALKEKPVPKVAYEIIFSSLQWIKEPWAQIDLATSE